ncbi:hypothetical protein KCU88_g3114, partial [Aureobasidium melanogenum]
MSPEPGQDGHQQQQHATFESPAAGRRRLDHQRRHPSPPSNGIPQLQHQQHHILQPTTSSSSHRALLTEGYDPTISPNRPLSPRSTATLFPNASIIALNPLTGRPVLPRLPVLPGRLRLSDADDDNNGQQNPMGGDDVDMDQGHNPHYAEDEAVARAYQRGRRRQEQEEATTPDHIQAAAVMAEAEAEAEADEERRDRERIERLLREMMARQRARAAMKSKSSVATSGPGGNKASSSQSHSQSFNRVARRRRGGGIDAANNINTTTNKGASASNTNINTNDHLTSHHHAQNETAEYEYFDDHDHDHDHDDPPDPTGSSSYYHYGGQSSFQTTQPDYSESEEAEQEELMGLIMGSLGREVARADEEAWMFGESSTTGMGFGAAGRDEIGVYD